MLTKTVLALACSLSAGAAFSKFTGAARPPRIKIVQIGVGHGATTDSLDPGLYDTNQLGPWKDKLRKSPVFGMTAMSVSEATDWGVFSTLDLPGGNLALSGERAEFERAHAELSADCRQRQDGERQRPIRR